MSLATRCPACSTTFRVVQDQLKVSGGWVRCGHCHEVFNGLESLFELPPDPPPAPPPPPVSPEVPVAVTTAPRSNLQPGDPDLSEPDVAEPSVDAGPQAPTEPPDEERVPVAEVIFDDEEAPDADPWADPSASSGSVPAMTPAHALAVAPEVSAPHERVSDAAASGPGVAGSAGAATWPPKKKRSRRRRAPKPAFVRQAEQAAQWRRPAVRAVLISAALALSLMLGAQVVHHQRDELAARVSVLRAPLLAWCELARCRIEPPRAVASLSLDSSGLSRTEHPQVLRFEADLRNSAGHAVRTPALEVSFTDALGQSLVRKVLLPEQLAAPASGIAPEAVWHVDARLEVGDLRVAGFTAEVFYP